MLVKLFINFAVCVLLAIHAASVQAQISAINASVSDTEQSAAQTTARLKVAYETLEESLADLDQLKRIENRISLRAKAAELLWSHDEERARTLFRQAIADLSNLTFDERAPIYQRQNERQAALVLRQQILQSIGTCDPLLALELLRSSAQALPWAAQTNVHHNYDAQLEMNLAQQIAARDPKLALKLAESRLSKGLSYEVTNVLWQLREKDAAAATNLAQSIIERLRSADTRADRQAVHVAYQLLVSSEQETSSGAQSNGDTPNNSRASLFDRRALGELAEFVAAAMLDNSMHPHELHNFAPQLKPLLQKYAPSRVAAVERRAQQAQRNTDQPNQLYNDFNARLHKGTVEDLLAWTAKAPPEMRDNFYQQVAWKAINDNDPARARQIITEHITNPEQRDAMLSQLEQQLAGRAISENRLSEARSMIETITGSEERFNAILQLAYALRNKKEIAAARAVLTDARTHVEASFTGARRMTAQMQLAQAFAGIDPHSGFAATSAAAQLLNDLLDHAAALDEYLPHQRSFEDGEFIISRHGSGIGELYRQWAFALQALAGDDLERAAAIAGEARRPELRLMTRLQIVQGTLLRGRSGHSSMKISVRGLR